MTTYVFEGQEVKKTGREAHRVLKIPQNTAGRILLLVEITPVEDEIWKKWVSPDQLYEVRDKNASS